MALPSSPRALFDAMSWHLRGLFATEANRRIAFRARGLWQPAEIEARKGIARDLAAQLPSEARIDAEQGFLMLPPSVTPALDEVCRIGHSIITNASAADGQSIGAKKFFRIRIASIEERVALLRVALDRRMLAMASEYLGVLPVISEADYFCSFPVDGPFTKSQLWHCDDDAADVLKLFIYCDDVSEADGPFTFIEPTASRRARTEVGYRYAGRRYRVADDVMEQHVTSGSQLEIVGPRGTAFAVDTARCFHRGSRILDKNRRRVMATICYLPPSARTVPRRLARGTPPLAELIPYFSDPVDRAALGEPVARRWV